MNNIIYESRLAKIILPKRYTTIMLFGKIFTKLREKKSSSDLGNDFFNEVSKNHELIHVEQYKDCFLVGFGLMILFSLIFGISIHFFALPFTLFYIIYLIEYLVSYFYHYFTDGKKNISDSNFKAYLAGALEMECDEHERNFNYLLTRKRFSWFKYYGVI